MGIQFKSLWRVRSAAVMWLMLPVALVACNRAEPEKAGDNGLAQAAPGGAPPASAAPSAGALSNRPLPGDPVVPSGSPAPAPTAREQGSSVMPVAANTATESQPVKPGVHIELSTPSLPSTGVETQPTSEADALQQRLSDRFFMKLTLPNTATPAEWLSFFADCDRAVQDLMLTRQVQQLTQDEFLAQAKRLSAMKYEAAEKLLASPALSAGDQRTATAARIESLSQLSGLGDVDAARKLQAHASELAASTDPELAHQGKLVLLGFRLNQLQEGQLKDPQELLRDADKLFVRPEDRSLVEMMALQQCADVLQQLGYANEAKQLLDTIVRNYRGLQDKELSMRAWALETREAPELAAFHQAQQALLAGTTTDASELTKAATALVRAYPTANTLVHCCRMLIDVEFSGNVGAAAELGQVIESARAALPANLFSPDVDTFMSFHRRRLELRGKPLQLAELVGFDGSPFDWNQYRGKVVLVCFWSTTAIHSLDEIQRLKELRLQVPSQDMQILGISVDEPLYMPKAEQMVMRQNFAWRNYRSNNPNALGFSSTSARTLGVNAVPFLVLVDRQGIVRAIHARAATSGAMINELLAEPVTSN